MTLSPPELQTIKDHIKQLALEFGFQDMRVADIDTGKYFEEFKEWVNEGYHGDMSFLERNQNLRENPPELHPNTARVISLRYDYLPEDAKFTDTLSAPNLANISRYAMGRDYHKIIRKKLSKLISRLNELVSLDSFSARVFVDSAPVLETAFAEKSGLGWKGKHTLIINEKAGSWFFLGEIFINLPLPIDSPTEDKCGNCTACINLCPTDAIIEDKKVDARRCISYLTIENNDRIPEEFREAIGNRIYGCDDCQLACPWNRYASLSDDLSFRARDNLNNISLKELWKKTEEEFLDDFAGSPIRRIGFQNWLRNLAVAIGNSGDSYMIEQLNNKKAVANEMVTEHIDWAMERIKQLNSASNIQENIDKKTLKLIRTVKSMLPRDA